MLIKIREITVEISFEISISTILASLSTHPKRKKKTKGKKENLKINRYLKGIKNKKAFLLSANLKYFLLRLILGIWCTTEKHSVKNLCNR